MKHSPGALHCWHLNREEITDDDIRVRENEGEGETTQGGETLDLFVLGKWYSSANFLLISI